jgi:Ran GTPase-activating protein (RanGAP) involved in mRNA processing and transport
MMSKNMRSEILKKIEDGKNSSRINLANMAIKDDEISEIMENLKLSLPDFAVLDLDNNQLSDDGALILAEYLCNFHHLTELSLQYNNIGRKGAISIFGLKKEHANLDILFHGNRIHDVGEIAEIERLSLSSTTHPIFGQR